MIDYVRKQIVDEYKVLLCIRDCYYFWCQTDNSDGDDGDGGDGGNCKVAELVDSTPGYLDLLIEVLPELKQLTVSI